MVIGSLMLSIFIIAYLFGLSYTNELDCHASLNWLERANFRRDTYIKHRADCCDSEGCGCSCTKGEKYEFCWDEISIAMVNIFAIEKPNPNAYQPACRSKPYWGHNTLGLIRACGAEYSKNLKGEYEAFTGCYLVRTEEQNRFSDTTHKEAICNVTGIVEQDDYMFNFRHYLKPLSIDVVCRTTFCVGVNVSIHDICQTNLEWIVNVTDKAVDDIVNVRLPAYVNMMDVHQLLDSTGLMTCLMSKDYYEMLRYEHRYEADIYNSEGIYSPDNPQGYSPIDKENRLEVERYNNMKTFVRSPKAYVPTDHYTAYKYVEYKAGMIVGYCQMDVSDQREKKYFSYCGSRIRYDSACQKEYQLMGCFIEEQYVSDYEYRRLDRLDDQSFRRAAECCQPRDSCDCNPKIGGLLADATSDIGPLLSCSITFISIVCVFSSSLSVKK